jgi:RimJ/RimL family protein N-acetyltransferase
VELRDDLIVLRHWRAEDADAVYEACQDLDMLQWLPRIPRPYTREDALAFVTRELDLGPHQYAIEKDGRVVGSIGMIINENETGHVGYWCLRSERGQGIVPRALRLLTRYAFEKLELGRVELVTDPDNASSQRVAVKLGFTREGVLRSHLLHPDGRRRDSVMFSLLPGELD